MKPVLHVACLLALLAGCTASPRPTLPLLDLDGQPFDLAQHGAAVTVVLFTRSDCPVANRAAPEILRLHDLFYPRGVEFYLVYVDPDEQPDAIRAHLKEYGYPCRGLRDPQHALVAHCGATTTPEAVVFNREFAITYRGRIDDQYADVGRPRAEPTSRDLADAIDATLTGRPVATPRTKAFGCLIADLKK